MHITYVEPALRERAPTNCLPWFRVALLCSGSRQICPEIISSFDSFVGKVAWQCISDPSAGNEFDVAFQEVDATNALIAVPGRSTERLEWLPVSVLTAQDFSVLPCLIHAVVAPAVVLGVPVCIDWEDIRYALGDGAQGFVAMVSGPADQAMARAYELIASEMNRTGARWAANSVVSTLIVPGGPSMALVRTAANFARSLVPSADSDILLPSLATADGTSMFALLVIADQA